ncbi:MAG TPA: hypothetical protein VGN83_09530 [Falsiroseomonas sp.]|nr:hypothetical protein [Falsiroseomonas sp.]
MTADPAIRAGLRFGALAFLAGALLGPVRELLLAPRLGGLPAAWIEAAGMAALLWLAAGLSLPQAPSLRDRALIAGTALFVVLLVEGLLSWVFVVTGLAAARAPRTLAEQAPGALLLLWLAALPFLRRRS